jgi:hypothetical protein
VPLPGRRSVGAPLWVPSRAIAQRGDNSVTPAADSMEPVENEGAPHFRFLATDGKSGERRQSRRVCWGVKPVRRVRPQKIPGLPLRVRMALHPPTSWVPGEAGARDGNYLDGTCRN